MSSDSGDEKTAPEARKTRPGRKLNSPLHQMTGDKNAQSRGFGLVLEVIRDEVGAERDGMLRELLNGKGNRETEPKFRIGNYDLSAKAATETIRCWETGKNDPPFGIQHRYHSISNVWSGALQLVGLFYSDLRDACKPEKRHEKLAEIEAVADCLTALSQAARDLATNYKARGLHNKLGGDQIDPDVRKRHKEVVTELLQAYRSAQKTNNK